MRAIVNTGPGRLELQEIVTPVPGPRQVRVRTAACGICATDIEMIAGWDRTGFPSIPGHEWAGVIDAVGPGVDSALVGRKCVAENVLSDGGEVGFEHPGGYGEYLITEVDRLHLLSDEFPLSTATLIEPLAVCVRGLRRLETARGGNSTGPFLVFGDGPVGLLMTSLLARKRENEVFLVGGRPERLTLARELGAAATLDYHQAVDHLPEAILSSFPGAFPAIAEVSGASKALDTALELAAPEGTILVLGDYAEARAGFVWNHLLHREITLVGSNASAGAWPEAVQIALEREIPLDRLITHRFPPEKCPDAVEMIQGSQQGLIKAIIQW